MWNHYRTPLEATITDYLLETYTKRFVENCYVLFLSADPYGSVTYRGLRTVRVMCHTPNRFIHSGSLHTINLVHIQIKCTLCLWRLFISMVIINSSCFIIIKLTTVHPTLLTCHPLSMYWMTQSLRIFQTINYKYRTALFHHLYQCLNLLLGSKIPTTGFFLFHLAKYTLLEFSIPINTYQMKADTL